MAVLAAAALTAASVGLATATTQAAPIGLEASASTAGIAPTTTLAGFNLGAGNTLAVLIAQEGGDQVSSGVAVLPTVTFNGVAVTSSVSDNEGNQRASIFYVINPTSTSGDVVVKFSNTTNNALHAVTAVSLSNVASLGSSGVFGEPDANLPYNVNYTGTADGFVLAAMADNTFSGGTALSITGGNVDTYLQRIAGTSSASAGRALAYGDIATDGPFTTTFTKGTGTSGRNAGALAAFQAVVPEPASLALVGLGTLAMFGRRRPA